MPVDPNTGANMSLSTQFDLAADAALKRRVRQAIATTALAVAGEAGTTANHVNRSQLATRLLGYVNDDTVACWAQAVVSDGATDGTASDATLNARVAALWNAFAGGL
jgi:hypothetical protein